MARRKAGEKKETGKKNRAAGEEVSASHVQADNQSIAFNGLYVGGNVGGDIRIGHTIGYTAEQVSVLLKQITTTLEPKKFDGRCPYKGLEVFEEEDAELFFGRERLVNELVGRVKESRTVFITGPSGSGKSSLVRAGLIHALKQGAIKSSDRWLYETMKPGREPLKDLALAFSRLKSPELEDYFLAHSNDTEILNKCAESVLSSRKDQRFVLFVDQFEEVFTQINSEEERVAFINMLAHAGTIENGRVIVLFAMRSDFVSNCATYPALNELLSQEFRQIGAMQPEELVSAIALPAMHVGLPVEPELIAQIINDMRGEPDALPLMQFALKDLFDAKQAEGGVVALTLKDYLKHGGIHKALERHADATFAKLSEREQELTRSIFSGLIEIGRGTQDTKRTALFDELIPANTKPEDVLNIVQKLADARLIITDEQAGKDTVTISHEKLIEAWPWLKKLVTENRDVIALQNEIASDAKEWEDHNRDESYLYSGARLANAREKLEAKRLALSVLAQTFVQTGIETEQTRQQEQELRQHTELTLKIVRQRAIYLTIALIAAIIAVGTAVYFSVQLRQQARLARALELAAVSNTTLDLDPELSLHLGMESIKNIFTLQGEDALRRALVSPPVRLTLYGHSGAIYSVVYDSEGKHLVTASADRTARIWDAKTGSEIMVLRGHTFAVLSAVFSPDGQLVATASADRTARIWDAKTGQQLLKIDKHSATVNSIAFSPNGQTIVTASDDQTARVWKVADGSQVYVLDRDTFPARRAIFSPNGKFIATGGNWGTMEIWDATTGELIKSLEDYGQEISAIAFSPDSRYILSALGSGVYRQDIQNDTVASQYLEGHLSNITSLTFNPFDGRQLVTTSADRTIRIWDTESGSQIEVLRGQRGEIYSAAFDPTGSYLATVSEDQTVRIWNIGEWRKRALIGFGGYPIQAVYSSDGHRIATTDSTGMVRIWDAKSGHELGSWQYPGWIANGLQFSPDGQQLITSSDDGTWRLWDILTGNQVFESNPQNYIVTDAHFNQDGTRIIITGRDGNGYIWDAKTKQLLVQLTGHSSGIWTGVFSPDGHLAVTASADQTARVWDAQTGEPLHILSGHNNLVLSAAFSPDGKRIVTASVDRTARIWDTDTGQLLRILKGHIQEVTNAVFSPDNKYIATVSRDRTFILWNADTGDVITEPIGQSKDIFSVAFSPDGKYLLTASLEGTARIYAVYSEDVLALARSLLSPRELTCAERLKYLHEELVCPAPTLVLTSAP